MASEGTPLAAQIGPADLAFGEDRIAAGASGGHDPRGQIQLIELQRVIEPRLEHRRWIAVIFGRSEYQDHVGRLRFFAGGLALNFDGYPGGVDQAERDNHRSDIP